MDSANYRRPDGLVPLPNGRIATVHNPKGIEPEKIFFDEAKVAGLIAEWQESRDPALLAEIISGCLGLIDSLVGKIGGRARYGLTREDFRGECILITAHVAEKFEPGRGRAFAYFSKAYWHVLLKILIRENKRLATMRPFDAAGSEFGGDGYFEGVPAIFLTKRSREA